jgi:hypothetical protein
MLRFWLSAGLVCYLGEAIESSMAGRVDLDGYAPVISAALGAELGAGPQPLDVPIA